MVFLLLHLNLFLFVLLDFKAVFTQYLTDTLFYISYFFTNVYVNSVLYPFLASMFYKCCILNTSEQVLYPDIRRYTNNSYYYEGRHKYDGYISMMVTQG